MEDDASIQILEPDADQQYVPERKEKKSSKPVQKVADVNWQKPPVLIVERQVAVPASQNVKQANVAAPQESAATRIVNIVEEKPSLWSGRVSDIVWMAIRFFIMAIFSFVALVLLNPPFVQETQSTAVFGQPDIVRRSASLSKAAAWAAGAGVAYLILPTIWDILSSKFISQDVAKALGL